MVTKYFRPKDRNLEEFYSVIMENAPYVENKESFHFLGMEENKSLIALVDGAGVKLTYRRDLPIEIIGNLSVIPDATQRIADLGGDELKELDPRYLDLHN